MEPSPAPKVKRGRGRNRGQGGGPGGRPNFNSPEMQAQFAKMRETMEKLRTEASRRSPQSSRPSRRRRMTSSSARRSTSPKSAEVVPEDLAVRVALAVRAALEIPGAERTRPSDANS